MKIVSWNVNGIRAWAKKGANQWFLDTQPDILGIQETKAHPDQLDEELRTPKGYFSYFDHSRTRKGYSGVAIFSKIEPEKVEYGLGVEALDQEGRLIIAHFDDFIFLNCYFPNGGGGPERLDYKLKYYDAFLKKVEKLRKQKPIIFLGDLNVAHNEIDLARPKENVENTGFLPIERAWADKVERKGYIDTFRYFYPEAEGAYSYWDMKTFARDRNVGWRIDYVFASNELEDQLQSAAIHSDVFGSDHCPVSLDINL